MLIFDIKSQPIILDSIHTPTITSNFWVLDLELNDFVVAPLLIFEEVTCPSLKIRAEEYKFIVPCFWNVLIVGDDTSQLDIIELSKSLGRDIKAFIYGPNQRSFESKYIVAEDYIASYANVTPLLNKHQLLCHPIAPDKWICITPHDIYNKYLKNMIVGDIL